MLLSVLPALPKLPYEAACQVQGCSWARPFGMMQAPRSRQWQLLHILFFIMAAGNPYRRAIAHTCGSLAASPPGPAGAGNQSAAICTTYGGPARH